MGSRKNPKLRNVDKIPSPFRMNRFPTDFALNVGKEVIYLLATRVTPRFEGPDWEEVFARAIHGRWKPSNVGLDDVLLEQTAWSAKTVKAVNPFETRRIRLISGRNSPAYSFDRDNVKKCDPGELGDEVLSIWNERVNSVRSHYNHLRTVVLIKSDDLLELSAFETETIMYQADLNDWSWNKNNNLVAHEKASGTHAFTWQPHGSQFTIVETVPADRLRIRLRQPPPLDHDKVLGTFDFDPSWIEVVPRRRG